MDFTRQEGLIKNKDIRKKKVTVIGAGAVGSFCALALTKLGVENLFVYDDDGVSEHNLPNQFYRISDAESQKFKTDALRDIVKDFCGADIDRSLNRYEGQPLTEVTVVATDNMASRKLVWEQFQMQSLARVLIEARMGGELGIVYTIQFKNADSKEFYNEVLHEDSESEEIPCTERSVIYNVLMISSLVCRAFKAYVNGEKYPREVVMDLRHLQFLTRD